jgi:16S rRNA processing protein RimM
MNKHECSFAGKISKLHGKEGAVILRNNIHLPENIEETEPVFIEIDKQLVPFFIDAIEVINNKAAIVKFIEIEDPASAKDILNKDAFVPLIPNLAQSDSNYYNLIGYTALVDNGKNIGTVKDLYNFEKNPVFVIYDTKEVLIPMQEDFIERIDTDQRIIYFKLPEGLLEV